MGKQKQKGSDAAPAAAAAAAPKPLSHFSHALIPPFKSKEDLTKALKATADALSAAPQSPDGAVSLGPLAGALVDRALLLHKDKDVRLRSAFCLAHALRVAAPDAPYSPAQLADAFSAFSDSAAELSRGRASAPAFELCLATLETIAAVRCSVLALDLDSPDAAVGLADACFAAVAAPRTGGGRGGAGAATMPLPLPTSGEEEDASLPLALPAAIASAASAVDTDHAAVEAAVLEILSTMLDEADELPPPLVDAVLSPLLPPLRDARPDAARCARALLRRCELKLQPAVQRLLVSAIESGGVGGGGGSSSSASAAAAATERAADLIAEVAATCPQALLPVLPKLQDELQVEDEARRAGAIAIAVSLLSAGGLASSSSSSAATAAADDANNNNDDDENPTTTTAAVAANAAAAATHSTHASLGASHAPLLDALLKRARDRSPSLRALVMGAVPGLLAGAPDSASRAATLAAAAGRLIDLDERVRVAAVTAICTCAQGDGAVKAADVVASAAGTAAPGAGAAAGSSPSSSSALLGLRALGTSSLQPLLDAGERLRDSSPGVARAAARGLLALFRTYAGALHRGEEVSSTEELVLWIPGKLLVAAAASADLRSYCADVLFARPPAVSSSAGGPSSGGTPLGGPPSLLPSRLSPKAVARQWACIWMACSPTERASACALLRARGSAAGAASEACAARAALRAAGGNAAAELSSARGEDAAACEARLALRRLDRSLVALSVVFPWPDRSRSVAALRALIADSKDNGVVRALAALAAPGTRSVDAAAAAAELVARAPQQHHAKEAAKVLAARLAPSLLPPEAIPELFAAAADPQGGGMASALHHARHHVPAPSAPDGRFAAAALSLLTDAAAADASLFARAAPAVADAIAADDALLRSASLQVLAAAGGAMRRAADSDAAAAAAAAAAALGGAGATTKATRTSPRGSKQRPNEDSDAAEDVLDALSDAAAEAAREGPPVQARTAVRALAALLAPEPAARLLRGVATRHVRHLASGAGGGGSAARGGALSDPRRTRVALASLGALGAAAPAVFATHAAAVADFVMAVMLPAPASAFGRGGALAAAGSGKSTASASSAALPPPSVAAAAKAEALEDLAAALVPDASGPLVLADARAAAAAAAAASGTGAPLRVRMTAEALAVADRLVPELAGLVDPDAAATDGSAAVAAAHAAVVAANDEEGGEELSPAARADAAALRTGASRALLTLLQAAETRVPSGAYFALSLVLQDQEADVRSAFRAALIAAVDATSTRGAGLFRSSSALVAAAASAPGSSSRASKLAAPLALSAVDPSKQAQLQALKAMRRFVAARREAVAQQMRQRAAAAAAGGAKNGAGGSNEDPTKTPSAATTDSLLHEAPEFSLTYLLQILAHHPDFPPCGPATGGGPFPAAEELAPFAAMLQLAIEPMVAGAASPSASSSSSSSAAASRASAGAALHALCKVLRAVRGCDDATAEPATPALALIADMGLALARALAQKHGVPLPSNALSAAEAAAAATTTAAAVFAGGASAAPSASTAAGDRFPGGVPLPKSLYKPADPPRPKLRDGALLPPGWAPQLADLIPAAAAKGGGAGGAGGGAAAAKKQARPRGSSVGGGGEKAAKKAKVAAGAGGGGAAPAAFPAAAAAAPAPASAAAARPAAAAKPKAKPSAAAAAATAAPAAPKPKKRAAQPSFEFDDDDDEDDDVENAAPPPAAKEAKGKAKAPAMKKKAAAKTAKTKTAKQQKTLDSWTSASATQTPAETAGTSAAAGPSVDAKRATRRGGGAAPAAAAAPAAERRSLRAR